MAKGQDALFRQWHMLRLLPRYPQKVSAQSICRNLAVEGFDITERTVQRDLNDLSALFPLFCDDREKPYGWSWQKDAASFDLPGLAIAEALALAMAEVHLEHMLPSPILDQLRTYFRAAHTRLDAQHNRGSGRSWMDKVRSVTPSQPLLVPKIEPGVHRVISEALLNDLQASVSYRRRSSKICLEYRIHPLAIVQRGQLFYLCCRIHDYEDIRILAVNRIMSAKLLDESISVPDGFDIDQLIDSGHFGFGAGVKIVVDLLFQPSYGEHLVETPLSLDQQITYTPEQRLRVTATIADTPQLRWWILGFGDGVEVISPAELRRSIATAAKEMLARYEN